MRDTVRGDSIYVPEQVQVKDSVKSGERRESGIGERPIDQQAGSLGVGGPQQRDIVQQRNAGVRDEPPRAKSAKVRFALERLDGAVSGWRAHQVDFLQPLAKAEIRNSSIADPSMPRHGKLSEVGQVLKNCQAAIRQLATRILAQIEMLKLRHARQLQQTVIRELARPSQVHAGYEI